MGVLADLRRSWFAHEPPRNVETRLAAIRRWRTWRSADRRPHFWFGLGCESNLGVVERRGDLTKCKAPPTEWSRKDTTGRCHFREPKLNRYIGCTIIKSVYAPMTVQL